MSSGWTVIIIICVVVVFGILITLAIMGEKKKVAAYTALTAATGWNWVRRDDSVIGLFSGDPFGRGKRPKAEEVLSGRIGDRKMVAFEYTYTTTSTSTDSNGHTTTDETNHPFHVVAVTLGAQMPRLDLTPEGFISRMAGRLTNKDIELESEEFNRAFTLTSDDRKFASDVMHPQMMEFALQHPEWSLRIADGWCLTIDRGYLAPVEIQPRLDHLLGVTERIPSIVWRQYGLNPELPHSPDTA